MNLLSQHRRRSRMLMAGAGIWLTANLTALAWIEHTERKARERRYGVADEVVRRFSVGTIRTREQGESGFSELPYRLLEPQPSDPEPPYPVIVFLHGAGERGNDNIRQLRSLPSVLSEPEMRDRYPCFLIAPQCPRHLLWGRSQAQVDTLDTVMKILDDILQRPEADPRRVYLTGFSMGGFGCWELAARYPERFAAIVPVAGGGDPTWGELLKDVPILAVHGADDNVVPISGTREMIEAIRTAGGAPQFLELPGVGHAAWRPAFRDSHEVLTWLFQQAKPDGLRVARDEAERP